MSKEEDRYFSDFWAQKIYFVKSKGAYIKNSKLSLSKYLKP